jgi:TonB-dependent receptor
MGSRVITLFNSRSIVGALYSRDFPMAMRHRLTAAWLLLSWIVQPLAMTAAGTPPVPLCHFAPQPAAKPNPFVWVSRRPAAPFLAVSPAAGTGWAETWQESARRKSTPSAIPPASHAWQPARVNENSPLTPPDGMPTVMPGPLPGNINASGNCVINGEVSDATSLNPVAGAFVDVAGTGRTAETDAKGRFTIGALPAGSFTLETTKLGYFGESTVVTTLEGQPAEPRFGLRLKPADDSSEETTLEEETVVGEYQGDSQGDLFLDLQATPNIAAGIGKEEFSQAAVSDAAGAVSKISGANIVGGKYAVVRGLGDRYSNTLVNGALISSADPSKKAVQLDLFPSDLLQSVAINKTFTPDLPAEFAGGIVLVETLRLPEKRIIEFELGIKTNSNLGDTFYANPDGDRDYWGQRDDEIPLADLPEGFLSQGWSGRRPPGVRVEGGVSREEQLARAAEAAAQMQAVHESGGMLPKKRSPQEEQNYAFTLGDRYKFKNGVEVGGGLAFTREAGDQVRENVQVGRGINYGSDSKPGSDGTPGAEDFVVRTQTEDQYTEYLNWGLLLGAGIKVGDNHEIGFTGFRNTSSEDEVSLGRKIKTIGGNFPEYLPSDSNPFGAGAYTYQAFDSINPLFRELETLQLDGTHKFGPDDRQFRLDWMAARSNALEDRPNGRTFYFSELDFADPRIAASGDAYQPSLGTQLTAADPFGSSPPLVVNFRESLKTIEEAANESIDLTIPVWKESDNAFLDFKIGTNHFVRDREVRGRLFTYNISPTLNNRLVGAGGTYGVDYRDGIDSPTEPDGSDRFLGWTGPQANSSSPDLIISEATLLGRTVRNVDAGNEIDAYYIMANAELAGWGLTGGVRLESEDRYYQVMPGLNPTFFVNDERVVTSNDYALPGITLWRNFGSSDQFKTIFAWSRTIARPTFYEYAPVEIQDQSTGDVTIGNPNLTDTLITNYDLRVDWQATDRDRVSVNLFHKSMTDPIAQAYALDKKTWVNGESGTLTGLEIELARQLGAGFSLTSNYTFIDSLLRYVQQINSQGQSQLVDSTFEGQPENIFNLILGYEHEEMGLRASLVYNFTDSYLVGVPATVESPSIVRDPYHSLDFVISKSFNAWNCDGKVTLKITNLLDSEDTEVFAPTELVYRSYSPGRSLSLSADFAF